MKRRPFDTFRTVLSGVKIPWILILLSMVSSFLLANAMVSSAVLTAQVVDSSGHLQTADLVRYIALLVISGRAGHRRQLLQQCDVGEDQRGGAGKALEKDAAAPPGLL